MVIIPWMKTKWSKCSYFKKGNKTVYSKLKWAVNEFYSQFFQWSGNKQRTVEFSSKNIWWKIETTIDFSQDENKLLDRYLQLPN